VIAVQNISQRNFGNWSMKFFGSDEISQYVPELKTLLKGSYEKVPQELLLLMRSIASAQNEQGAGDSKPAA
jgi:hypothetical protein